MTSTQTKYVTCWVSRNVTPATARLAMVTSRLVYIVNLQENTENKRRQLNGKRLWNSRRKSVVCTLLVLIKHFNGLVITSFYCEINIEKIKGLCKRNSHEQQTNKS